MDSSSLVASVADTARAARRAQTAGYFASFLALGLVSASLGPTVPHLAAQTNADLGAIGYLFTARSGGYLLGSFLSGRVYDRVPGHPVFAVGIVAMIASLALVPTISVLWLLMVVLLLIGIVEGFIDVGGNTLLVWLHRDEVGPLMNGLHFCFGFGAFLAPLVVAQVAAAGSWYGWTYWLIALALIPLVITFMRLGSPTAPKISADDSQEAINWQLVGLLALFFLLYVAAEVGFGGWILTYTLRQNLYGEETAAYLVSAFWGAIMAGRLLGMPLATRLRPRTILLSDLLLCIASVACIIAWPESHAALWLGTVGLGLGMASIFPTALAFAQRRIVLNGTITSIFLVGSSIGSMTLPWLIGQLFERYGPLVTMQLVLGTLLLECGVFALLLRAAPTPRLARSE